MFEIDKIQFGNFLSAQRKAKGFTQKELAQKLFVSDKAVSKWERGLSLPDITLLMPLAELLDVSVTELLEGKRLEHAEKMDADQIEILIKKALTYSEKPPQQIEKQKKLRVTFGLCILSVLLEWLLLILYRRTVYAPFQNLTLLLQILGLSFGAHFFLCAKERLPAYYDVYPVYSYHDGLFEMNLPGVRFTNRNWPQILRVCRIWCILDTTVFPMLSLCFCFFASSFLPYPWVDLLIPGILSFFSIGILFVQIYRAAKNTVQFV